MSQYNQTFDLKTNVGHCDLYCMIHWFCLISRRLFDVWTPYWDYESVWPNAWPQNKGNSLWPLFHGPLILPYILKAVCCRNIIIWDYESVWPNIWPQNKCRSLWPIFHGSVSLPYISKTIWWMSVIFSDNIMRQCDSNFDRKLNIGQIDLYFMVYDFA